MPVHFKVWYPPNLFELIDNMSQWSIYTQGELIKQYPHIYKEIKEQLPVWAQIRNKNPWRSEFQNIFATDDLQEVYAKIKNNEAWCPALDILVATDKRYRQYWTEIEQILHAYKVLLENNWRTKAERDLATFYDLKSPVNATVMLLYSKVSVQGGVNYKNTISLFVGHPAVSIYTYTGTLIHELAHYYGHIENKSISKLLRQRGIERKTAEYIEEAIMDCIAPRGLLTLELKYHSSNRIFKNPDHIKIPYMAARERLKKILFPTVEEYWRNKDKQSYASFVEEVQHVYDENKEIDKIMGKILNPEN